MEFGGKREILTLTKIYLNMAKKKNFEIKFYEDILEKRPNFTNVLSSLGDAYTSKGFYHEGLAVDQRLVKLKPEDPIVYYNLACSLSLVGRLKESLGGLRKAVLFGYDDFKYIMKDPDLKDVRELAEFDFFF